VVINERTGTVVVGADVKLATTAVAHGNLTILINETPEVSQPDGGGGYGYGGRGRTVVVPRTTVEVGEQRALLNIVPRASTVADLARALNTLGVTPRDLISIFQALKRAGALYAEIEVL
jgi:flagellar P-ring protein precursor FlgI